MATKSKSKKTDLVSESIPMEETGTEGNGLQLMEHQFEFINLRVDNIDTGMNIRSSFDDESMNALIESVKIYGVLEPPIVAVIEGRNSLIAGERRIRAAKAAGIEEVLCKVYSGLDSSDIFEIMLTENLLRADLNPIEEAVGFKKILDANMSQEELGRRIGRSQEYVSNRMKLLDVSEVLQRAIISREITPSHVIVISSYSKYEWYDAFVDFYNEKNKESIQQTGSPIPVKSVKNTFDGFFRTGTFYSKSKYRCVDPFNTYELRQTSQGEKCSECKKKVGYGICIDLECHNQLKAEYNEEHKEEIAARKVDRERSNASLEDYEKVNARREAEVKEANEKAFAEIRSIGQVLTDAQVKDLCYHILFSRINSYTFGIEKNTDREGFLQKYTGSPERSLDKYSRMEICRFIVLEELYDDIDSSYEFRPQIIRERVERYQEFGISFSEEFLKFIKYKLKKKSKSEDEKEERNDFDVD